LDIKASLTEPQMFVNQTESTLFIESLKKAGIAIHNEREVIERLAEAVGAELESARRSRHKPGVTDALRHRLLTSGVGKGGSHRPLSERRGGTKCRSSDAQASI
jgi:hypothetical protein